MAKEIKLFLSLKDVKGIFDDGACLMPAKEDNLLYLI